jgi:hypothetical protein
MGVLYAQGAQFRDASITNTLYVKGVFDFGTYSINAAAGVGQITRTKDSYYVPETSFSYKTGRIPSGGDTSTRVTVTWNGQKWSYSGDDYFIISY